MAEIALAAKRLRVALAERSYDILVGSGLLSETGQYLRAVAPGDRLIIVTDTNVAPLFLPVVERSCTAAGLRVATLSVPAGEASKNFATLAKLAEDALRGGIDRQTTIVALGGGVVGDLAGLLAAILLRGISYVQVPTTLLAQVDSSVGGKTAIDMPQGKNLVGTFHQPRLVLADIDTLATLPRRELLAGYAEVAKYGLINDAAFFSWLEDAGATLCTGDTQARQRAVLHCCRAKAAVVAADEREDGERALLNLGHTFAHALEAEAGYGGELLHGEAVAIGMTIAFDLSRRLGLCPAEDAARVARHLAAIGLPTRPAQVGVTFARDRLLARMGADKKARGGQPTFILARGIGKAFIATDVPMARVAEALDAALAG